MDYGKLIEQAKKDAKGDYPIVPNWAAIVDKKRIGEYATALSTLQAENEKLRAELEQVKRCIEIVENQRDQMKRERDAAIDCIYKIEDALDRGNDNDWAKEHISEWESQKED